MWYKRAIDQHTIEPESFVFSVPFNSGYFDFFDTEKCSICNFHTSSSIDEIVIDEK